MVFETVIGLEVHVQLSTASKIFCRSSTAFGADPNHHVDPVTMGFPGALPVLNKKVVESAMRLGLALNCDIRNHNRFARKHYFYPDLPKGYQISQFEEPICERGAIKISVEDTVRTIGITRIHMEEDAGKNIHDARTQASLIDLNRAGVPLLEVVSEPDLRSAAEAVAFLKTLRQIVRHLDVGDGNMEEGSLRCDANISLRPEGQLKYGTRAEIKNLNSFKFVEQAIEYEVARQTKLLREGKTIDQETRLFDNTSGVTKSMRGKEGAADYRYMPDPDLPPLVIEESWITRVKNSMPMLPEQKREQLVKSFGLSDYDASVLTSDRSFIEFFERTFSICQNAKAACNWITSELFGLLNKNGIELGQSPISSHNLGELIKAVDSEIISGKMAKGIFEEMFTTGKSAKDIIESKGLKQITDPTEVAKLVNQAFDNNQTQLSEYLAGDERIHPFFVGQVMKLSGGKANPRLVNEIIKTELTKRSA